MKQEDIIRMAREAGLHLATDVNWMPVINLAYAEKFAALVKAAENEACAVTADEHMQECEGKSFGVGKAIRARGQA
jgi:hypothetical protein